MTIEIIFKNKAEYNIEDEKILFSGKTYGFRFIVMERNEPENFKKMFNIGDANRLVFVTDDKDGILYAGRFKANGERMEDYKTAQGIARHCIMSEIERILNAKRSSGAIW